MKQIMGGFNAPNFTIFGGVKDKKALMALVIMLSCMAILFLVVGYLKKNRYIFRFLLIGGK